MASAAAAEVAGKAASLLKFGAGVYLFRDWLCEPTVVRLEIGERKKKEKRGSRRSTLDRKDVSSLFSTST